MEWLQSVDQWAGYSIAFGLGLFILAVVIGELYDRMKRKRKDRCVRKVFHPFMNYRKHGLYVNKNRICVRKNGAILSSGAKPINIIGVSGITGSGKDEFVKMLTDKLKEYNVCGVNGRGEINTVRLSDPLKEIASEYLFGQQSVYYPTEREIVRESYGISPRFFLQELGEFFRNLIGQDALVRIVKDRIISQMRSLDLICDNIVIVPDIRNREDVEHIRGQLPYETFNEACFILIKIDRPSLEHSQKHKHKAERRILDEDADILIINDEPLDGLRDTAEYVVRDLIKPLRKEEDDEDSSWSHQKTSGERGTRVTQEK